MMIQNHAAWPQQIGLPCHELGEGALNGFAIDGAASSRSQDSDIWAQIVQDAAPMSARILIQQRAFLCLEQIHEALENHSSGGGEAGQPLLISCPGFGTVRSVPEPSWHPPAACLAPGGRRAAESAEHSPALPRLCQPYEWASV